MSITRLLQQASGGSGVSGDPDFADVSLLLDGDGTNGANNSTFTDSSSNNFGVTETGDVAQGSFSPYAASSPLDITTDGGSGYFNGASYLSTQTLSGISASQEFCIEAWIYLPSSVGLSGIFGGSNSTGGAGLRIDGSEIEFVASNVAVLVSSPAGTITVNTWHHVAVTRDASTEIRLFVDGAVVDNTNSTRSFPGGTGRVGARYISGTIDQKLTGYISDLNYVVGDVVYNSNFVPPTVPIQNTNNTELLLNFQDAGIYDLAGKNNIETVGNASVSTAQKKYGTGSLEFDGSGDRLAARENGTDFTFGTGDFTIECWVYIDQNLTSFIFDWRKQAGNQGRMPSLYIESGVLKFYSAGLRITSNSITGRLNQWLHVALVRSSGQLKLYVDGTQEGTNYADSNAYISPQDGNVYIGGRPDGYAFDGYIDDFRITKGVARYTSNFTPPTAALPKF